MIKRLLLGVVALASVLVACGGDQPAVTSDDGLLPQKAAIARAAEELKRPAPEISGVENPRNPVAWRATLNEWNRRTGVGPSTDVADTPVWVVQVEGESRDDGIVPPESRKTYRYAVAVLDARTGNVIAARRSNEPLSWAVPTDARSMSDPERMVRAPQATSADARELPEDWRRVQVREGFVGRGFENPLAGFTIDLPPGWRAGESWPSTNGPSGWIAGAPPEGNGNVAVLRFWMGSGPRYSAEELEKNPRYDVRRLVIDGIPVLLHLARPDAIDQGPQVGIYYERIPGGPIGEKAPSLRMEGDSRGFTDQVLLGRVLTSARYAEIAELPGLPEAVVEPGADWQRVPARSDRPSFTMMLPPGWQTTNLRGIDSLVGRISGGGITLTYDFGGFAGVPYGDASEVRERREGPPHVMWEEKIGDLLFWFVRPVSPQPDDHAVTGLFVDLEGNPPRTTISSIDTPRLSVAATGLSGPQQETVLAILRTIELERKSPTPPPPPR